MTKNYCSKRKNCIENNDPKGLCLFNRRIMLSTSCDVRVKNKDTFLKEQDAKEVLIDLKTF